MALFKNYMKAKDVSTGAISRAIASQNGQEMALLPVYIDDKISQARYISPISRIDEEKCVCGHHYIKIPCSLTRSRPSPVP
jgi:hypothetical protein